MKLREKLKNVRQIIAGVFRRFPVEFREDIVEFAEAVKEARDEGFTDEELQVLGVELRRLLGEFKKLRKG